MLHHCGVKFLLARRTLGAFVISHERPLRLVHGPAQLRGQILRTCVASAECVFLACKLTLTFLCTAPQFVNFAAQASGQSLTVDDFWSNPLCMQYYKNLVSFWLNHPNKLANGLQFKVSFGDPTRRLCIREHTYRPWSTTRAYCNVPTIIR